jgi:hypothetical protein
MREAKKVGIKHYFIEGAKEQNNRADTAKHI